MPQVGWDERAVVTAGIYKLTGVRFGVSTPDSKWFVGHGVSWLRC